MTLEMTPKPAAATPLAEQETFETERFTLRPLKFSD